MKGGKKPGKKKKQDGQPVARWQKTKPKKTQHQTVDEKKKVVLGKKKTNATSADCTGEQKNQKTGEVGKRTRAQ